MSRLRFAHALLPDGWADDVLIEVGPTGDILRVDPSRLAPLAPQDEAVERVDGVAVPGLPNLHSHAFQRGMAGLAERRGEAEDSFWTWREVMYRFLDRLTPDDVEAIAELAYAEMLESGFTSVAEFHYLHHQPGGAPYDDPAEMAGRIAAAAEATGIGLTLLPVFYAQSGFGGAPIAPGQIRLRNDPDEFARLVEASRSHLRRVPDAALGVAPHSLRAVTPENLRAVLGAAPAGPIHIHAAEQVKEVEDCLAWSGARPVEWLLDNAAVDARWCLIHATQMVPEETAALARSGAVAGLCPVTEANLGDGIFDGRRYLAADGRYGIGTDSNVRIGAADELRALEYAQRLRDRARNVLGAPNVSTGRRLFDGALQGGAQACGRRIGRLEAGMRADIVVLDESHPALVGRRGDAWLDGWIFAGGEACVRDVWVGGRQVVAEGRRRDRETIHGSFTKVVRRLLD